MIDPREKGERLNRDRSGSPTRVTWAASHVAFSRESRVGAMRAFLAARERSTSRAVYFTAIPRARVCVSVCVYVCVCA
jgi:hypothetical protein